MESWESSRGHTSISRDDPGLGSHGGGAAGGVGVNWRPDGGIWTGEEGGEGEWGEFDIAGGLGFASEVEQGIVTQQATSENW